LGIKINRLAFFLEDRSSEYETIINKFDSHLPYTYQELIHMQLDTEKSKRIETAFQYNMYKLTIEFFCNNEDFVNDYLNKKKLRETSSK
jgi:hypothetical protein